MLKSIGWTDATLISSQRQSLTGNHPTRQSTKLLSFSYNLQGWKLAQWQLTTESSWQGRQSGHSPVMVCFSVQWLSHHKSLSKSTRKDEWPKCNVWSIIPKLDCGSGLYQVHILKSHYIDIKEMYYQKINVFKGEGIISFFFFLR